jgi:carboxyl-terminal processing protease
MRTDVLAKQNDKEYPLQLEQFRKEQKATRAASKEIERLIKMERAMNISYLKQDEQRYVSDDKDKTERYKQWLTNVSRDVYVDQAVKVVHDIVNQQNLAKSKEPVKTF